MPISLDELYEKEKKRPSRSALSIEQLLDQLKSADQQERSASRTEINKRFSFPFACVAFAIIGVPLGVTAHCCYDLFSLCHHWRYVARQPEGPSRTACLVSQCSVYRAGCFFVSPIGPAISLPSRPNFTKSISAFLIIIGIPLSYSIADGLALGFIS